MKLHIDAEPVAQARAKTTYANGKVWTYRPHGNKEAEQAIGLAIRSAGVPPFGVHVPLKLTVAFYRTQAQSNTDKMPVRKPDVSNFEKSIEESLVDSGIIPDDAQIVHVDMVKRWSPTGKGYIELELDVEP